MTSKITTFVTSISAIGMERYVNERTDEKKMILHEMHCQSGDIEDSLCGVITVPIVKINKITDSGAPRLRVNEVGFVDFLQQLLHYKVNNYPLTKINRCITLGT